MSETGKIDRLPGRLVVSSLVSLYLWFGCAVTSAALDSTGSHVTGDLIGMFARLFGYSSLPLIFLAIVIRLTSR